MKYLALLLIFGFGISGFGQTIKSLGYNTTNGQVVANTGTNTLTFTNRHIEFANGDVALSNQIISGTALSISFEDGAFAGTIFMDGASIEFSSTSNAATTRTNLGLGATWLTNTNVTNFRTAVGLGATNDVSFNTVEVDTFFVTGTNPLTVPSLFVQSGAVNFNEPLGAATTRTNLGLGWPALTNTNAATSLLGFTTNGQVVYSGTNTLTFTNDVKLGNGELTVSGQVISGSGVSFSYEDGNFIGPLTLDTNSSISFQGASAATTRTNLGLGGGITTNRTFVSYNGTNYTTNTVTISNGIITGWTQ